MNLPIKRIHGQGFNETERFASTGMAFKGTFHKAAAQIPLNKSGILSITNLKTTINSDSSFSLYKSYKGRYEHN